MHGFRFCASRYMMTGYEVGNTTGSVIVCHDVDTSRVVKSIIFLYRLDNVAFREKDGTKVGCERLAKYISPW